MEDFENNTKQQQKASQPDWLLRGVIVLFIVAAVITSVLASRFVYERVSKEKLINIPGNPILPTSPADNGEGNDVNESRIVGPGDTNQPGSDNELDQGSRITILFMGLDYRDWQANDGAPRTDTMILFTLDPVSMTVGILSLPRDLWVNIPGYGYGKINTAYQLGVGSRYPDGGGPGLAMRTVEEFLGISINYFIQVDFQTFADFIDDLGGVEIDITETIELEIIGKRIDVVLEPGRYDLPGDHALAYVRNRSTSGGDFDRAQRQQQVILAIRDRLLAKDIYAKLFSNPGLYWDKYSSGIKTNLKLDEIISLGLLAKDIEVGKIKRGAISVPDYVTLGKSPDGLDILKPITQNIRVLRDEIFTSIIAIAPSIIGSDPVVLMQTEGATVRVLNGTLTGGLAGFTEEYLVGLGVNVVEVGNSELTSFTTIYDYSGKPYTVQYLVDLMGIQNTRIFYANDPSSGVDIQIILGSDWIIP